MEVGNLILTRFEGETLVIGNNVFVKVITARDGKSRLAVMAPKTVAVDRLELREQKIEDARIASLEAAALCGSRSRVAARP